MLLVTTLQRSTWFKYDLECDPPINFVQIGKETTYGNWLVKHNQQELKLNLTQT
jgi:hypothetical protein